MMMMMMMMKVKVKVKVGSAQDNRDWIFTDNHGQLLEHSVIGIIVHCLPRTLMSVRLANQLASGSGNATDFKALPSSMSKRLMNYFKILEIQI